MNTLLQQYDEAAAYVQCRLQQVPRVAIVLGSGLGVLADRMTDATVVPYTDIPHFKASTAVGHKYAR